MARRKRGRKSEAENDLEPEIESEIEVDTDAEVMVEVDDEPEVVSPAPRDRRKRRRRSWRFTPRRWLPFLAFVALVAGLVVADRTDDPVERPTTPVDRAGSMLPVAAGPEALSTAFFCSGGTALGEDGAAELAILIANASLTGTTADLTFVGTDDVTRSASIDVPAAGRVRVSASDYIEAEWVAATVEVLGPEVTVEKIVTGPLGYERGPCPTTASDVWYVPSGSTEIGAEERLVLYNPFPAPSSVDIAFATNDGRLTPGALKALDVPAGGVVVVDTDVMPARKTEIAATITTRTGRIVVDRVQTYDGTGQTIPADGDAAEVAAPYGLASTPAVATTSTRWLFPDAVSVAGNRTRIALYNPTAREAEIDLVLTYEDPARRSEIEPIRVTLPGDEQRMVDLRSVPGLDSGEPFMVRVESLGLDGESAVPVVAEQVVDNGVLPPDDPTEDTEGAEGEEGGEDEEGTGEAPPEEQGEGAPGTALVDGLTIVGGSPVMAPTWLLSASGASDGRVSTVVVANPGDETASVTVEVVANGSRAGTGTTLEVPAGDRRVVDLGEADPTALYVISGSSPIVVSRSVVSTDDTGIAISLGAPLPVDVTTLPAAS